MKTPEGVLRNRHNKVARGMTKTIYESNQRGRISDDVCTLSVKGTLDKLHGLTWLVRRLPCSCCGCKCRGKLALNDSGKLRLKTLRNRRNDRLYGGLNIWAVNPALFT